MSALNCHIRGSCLYQMYPNSKESYQLGCTLCGVIRSAMLELMEFYRLVETETLTVAASFCCFLAGRPSEIMIHIVNADVNRLSLLDDLFCRFSTLADINSAATRQFPPLPEINPLPVSNGSLIKAWIDTCERSHAKCTSTKSLEMPTRLVDVTTSNPTLYIANGKPHRYAALSYCWGIPGSNHYMTTSDTISKQDDKLDTEWEIKKMTSIYGGAYVTLCATVAASSDAGILSQISYELDFTMPFTTSSGEITSYNILCDNFLQINSRISEVNPNWLDVVDSSTWNHRAWTFQERLISKRIVHFAKNKLFFECGEMETSEDGDENGKSKYFHHFILGELVDWGRRQIAEFEESFSRMNIQASSNPNLRSIVLGAYYTLVCDYSRRNLSFQSDKESAFSAIIEKFRPLLPLGFICGLWTCNLITGLLWQCHWSTHPAKNLWPSWSWYSQPHGVWYYIATRYFGPHACNDIIFPKTIEFAPATVTISVAIKITTITFEVELAKPDEGMSWRGYFESALGILFDGELIFYVELDAIHDRARTSRVLCYLCYLPSKSHKTGFRAAGRLLERTEKPNHFRRIGMFDRGIEKYCKLIESKRGAHYDRWFPVSTTL